MGSLKAKPSSTRMKKEYYRGRQSPSLILLVKVTILALAASAVPFLIIYTLPSLKVFLFHVIPSLWSLSCSFFTPIYLFVLLNLIILSILSMAHLHAPLPAAAASPLQSACGDRLHQLNSTASDDVLTPSVSEDIKLGPHEFADLQLVDEDGASEEDQYVQEVLESSSYGAGVDHDDDDDQEGGSTIVNADLVMRGVIEEAHLQQQAEKAESDRSVNQLEEEEEEEATVTWSDHSIDKGLAGPAGRGSRQVAEEDRSVEADQLHPHTLSSFDHISGSQGESVNPMMTNDPLSPFEDHVKLCNNIDSLLSEEGSIFTQVESRPLTSARFTHKKAGKIGGAHDRPHSPLRSISRPTIVKRGGDTFEATWKAICESKRHASPLKVHYSKHTNKKVDTFEGIIDGVPHKPYSSKGSSSSPLSPIKQRSKKNIVMNSLHDHDLTKGDATTTSRKPSMPQEELNAKVESFISRFNEQMRIQREKSLLDYMEMVGRGTR